MRDTGALQFHQVRYGRGHFRLEVDLIFPAGSLTVVLGPSGCGKTTLLDLAAGFQKPWRGRIIEGGRDVSDEPPNKRNIGVVFQDFALFPHMSVLGNVSYGPRVRGLRHREADKRAMKSLAFVHMDTFARRRITTLSGGEEQRVALARALAINPDLLLLDEPFSSLDAALRRELRREVRRIQLETGLTVVLVSHDQDEALALADHLVVMKDGLVTQVGSPWELWNNPKDEFTAAFLGRSTRLGIRRYKKTGNSRLLAETASGPVLLPPGTNPVELPAMLVLRPGNISSSANGELTGIVKSTEYTGGTWTVHLEPEDPMDGDIIDFDISQETPPKAGSIMKFRPTPGSGRLIPVGR